MPVFVACRAHTATNPARPTCHAAGRLVCTCLPNLSAWQEVDTALVQAFAPPPVYGRAGHHSDSRCSEPRSSPHLSPHPLHPLNPFSLPGGCSRDHAQGSQTRRRPAGRTKQCCRRSSDERVGSGGVTSALGLLGSGQPTRISLTESCAIEKADAAAERPRSGLEPAAWRQRLGCTEALSSE